MARTPRNWLSVAGVIALLAPLGQALASTGESTPINLPIGLNMSPAVSLVGGQASAEVIPPAPAVLIEAFEIQGGVQIVVMSPTLGQAGGRPQGFLDFFVVTSPTGEITRLFDNGDGTATFQKFEGTDTAMLLDAGMWTDLPPDAQANLSITETPGQLAGVFTPATGVTSDHSVSFWSGVRQPDGRGQLLATTPYTFGGLRGDTTGLKFPRQGSIADAAGNVLATKPCQVSGSPSIEVMPRFNQDTSALAGLEIRGAEAPATDTRFIIDLVPNADQLTLHDGVFGTLNPPSAAALNGDMIPQTSLGPVEITATGNSTFDLVLPDHPDLASVGPGGALGARIDVPNGDGTFCHTGVPFVDWESLQDPKLPLFAGGEADEGGGGAPTADTGGGDGAGVVVVAGIGVAVATGIAVGAVVLLKRRREEDQVVTTLTTIEDVAQDVILSDVATYGFVSDKKT